jgi:voltage-gated potassium channel
VKTLETEHRRKRWEAAGEIPLAVASLAFLAAYAWPILDLGLSATLVSLCSWVVWGSWAVLVADFLVRLVLSESRSRFILSTPLELATIALPLLRPLRLLRLLTLLAAVNRHAGSTLRGRVGIYVASSMLLVVFVASLAVLDAERGRGGNINDFGDAVWWSMTTISTIGYGDRFPVTGTGRLVAVGLMLAGIALLGIVTASVATWLVERVADTDDEASAATRADLAAVRKELAEVKALLVESRARQDPG